MDMLFPFFTYCVLFLLKRNFSKVDMISLFVEIIKKTCGCCNVSKGRRKKSLKNFLGKENRCVGKLGEILTRLFNVLALKVMGIFLIHQIHKLRLIKHCFDKGKKITGLGIRYKVLAKQSYFEEIRCIYILIDFEDPEIFLKYILFSYHSFLKLHLGRAQPLKFRT